MKTTLQKYLMHSVIGIVLAIPTAILTFVTARQIITGLIAGAVES